MLNFTFLVDPSSDQIKQITGLYRSAGWWGRDMPDDHSLVKQIIKGSHCFMIATEDDKIIGMGRAISDRASDSYIQDLTIISSYRGKGIGRALMEKTFESARRLGYRQLYLESLPELGRAISLYEKAGFKNIPGPLGNSGHFGCNIWMLIEL